MYHHHIWEDKFSIHELSQQGSRLKVVPARGGIITEWAVDGEAVLYLDPQTLQDNSKNIRGGIPILFPICGPLRDGQYQWEDQTYQMKQHGLARNLLWEVTGVEVSDGEALLSLETVANSETKLVYPFDFQLVFNYVLKPNSLLIKQSYLNNSAKVMPFYAGFHPYFYAPQRQGVKLNIPSPTSRYRNLLTGLEEEFAGCLRLEDVPEGNYVFEQLSGQKVTLGNYGTGREIVLEFAEEFRKIVVWALAGQDFVCVEPWMADNYTLNTGQGLYKLGPKEQLDTWISITVNQK
ncbi:MAG: hypothetical protein WA118_06395 [Carboxydocellales bacterium]